ncbi:MAG: radical SAM protein [Caldilineaceae bacterium]|nr:radical SAM protein [Caldilineaceae bacterium]MCY4116480.1 radical SAM protein [Caldilineaceae bacterium]
MFSAESGASVHPGQAVIRERPARSALTRTGGFLTGFSHSLQPYIGCRFGCSYCYVRYSNVHRFNNGGYEWGDYVYPRVGIAEQLERELDRLETQDQLEQTAVFMSSATDPYQGAESRFGLTRQCLAVFVKRPPGLLAVQTRSPLASRDFDMMAALGDRCLLNVSLETDRDDVRQRLTPRCPSIGKRLATVRQAREAGIPTQVTVSPCLPYSGVETFGELLLNASDRVVVDSFVAGDGGGGKRTARTAIPALYAESSWHDWRSQEEALRLYHWLHDRNGEQVGWSQEGFTRQARSITGRAGKPAAEELQARYCPK